SDGLWGMVALVSLIAVVKGNDIGAYTAGRLTGRHKMTPVLSPGKTWEGFTGGMVMSVAAAWVCLGPFATWIGAAPSEAAATNGWWFGVVLYGLLVGLAGVAGDLAISLLKRDAGLKNSSSWLPGLGGVLDLLDSVLLGAPVAYVLWVAGVVGPT
ncbi:MAG: phosphatidate cytidylyltransferase, partial [Planctomycetota bacterium]